MEKVDCVVIGAGVVGLAVARRQAMLGREVIVLEAESAIGTQTSARNSEVIHAGIYYPKSSMKAALCVPGKEALYAFCKTRNISHRRCGKLIVATGDGQLGELQAILKAGLANGVDDLEYLERDQVHMRTPDLRAEAAIWSPSTGIIDSQELMLALHADIEAHGGLVAFDNRVSKICVRGKQIGLNVNGDKTISLETSILINCAGLEAIPIARLIDELPAHMVPEIEYAKGSYFSYSGKTPFDCLIYPIPTPGGLGIHLTLDQAGQARFGPDVQWIDSIDLSVNEDAKSRFVDAVSDYWPAVDPARMHAAYAGIRAKTKPEGRDYHDFIFSGPQDHGIRGLVNLFGIESPGLTSCLSIADHVAAILDKPL